MLARKVRPVFVDVAAALLSRARAIGARSLSVVGTSKNAGKTVVVAALIDGLRREGVPHALCSIGRDGEAIDAIDAHQKPRLYVHPGALLATAASLVPRSPALEILSLTGERSALGPIVIARVRAAGAFEIAGPPSAEAARRIVAALGDDGRFVVIDGAVDRTASLRESGDAIVAAVGAATAPALPRALDEIAALVERLRLPRPDPGADAVRVNGPLLASAAVAFVRAGERRQIVVDDPTMVTLRGRTFLDFASRLDLRVERALHVVACTVAPFGAQHSFEPRAFARAVAARTGLPAYDVYAGTVAEPAAA